MNGTGEVAHSRPIRVPSGGRSRDPAPWLAHYPPGVPPAVGTGHPPIVDAFRASVDEWGGSPAYGYMGRELLYAEVSSRVETLAAALLDLGVARGDRVLICLPNIPAAPVAILATWFAGATAVVVNPLLSANEHAWIIRDAQPTAAVVLDVHASRFVPGAEDSSLRACVIARVGDDLPLVKAIAAPLTGAAPRGEVAKSARVRLLREVLAIRGAPPAGAPGVCPEDLAAVLYTGGTTGDPKGVELTHRHIATHAAQIASWFTGFADGRIAILGVFPFFSAAGLTALMAQALLRGACVELLPRPSPASIVASLRRRRIDVFPAVPTIYQGLLDAPELDRWLDRGGSFPAVCISGAAPLPRTVFDRWLARTGHPIRELYGMTETTAMIAGAPIRGPIVAGGVGFPLPDTRLKIVSDAGEEQPLGEVGEVLVAGPQIMRGYHGRPDATAAVLTDGWLRTGDLGRLDPEGRLMLVGRKKEMILSSGYNVYPAQVELAITGCDAIAEAACVGVPDAYRGESLVAFVVPRAGKPFDLPKLKAHCREHVAAYAVPVAFHVVDSLPRNALGKVRKEILARQVGASSGSEPVVRVAKPADVPAICRLLAECSRLDPGVFSRTEADVRRRLQGFFVLVDGGRVQGVVSVHDHGRRDAELRSLAIAPDVRGRGLSIKLLEPAIAKARADGFRRVWLDSDKPSLYADKLGFEPIARWRMARVVPLKIAQVFKQPPTRWRRAFTGQFTPMELDLGRPSTVRR